MTRPLRDRLGEADMTDDAESFTTTFTPMEQLPVGWKADGGKLPMHLLPPEFLTATAAVLDFGAK